MGIDFQKIYFSRNRTKRQHQIYIHEAEYSVASREADRIMGKNSGSLFFWASGCIILGMLGHKFNYMNKKDRICILLLKKELDKRISYNQ
jgi:hypothetical protein